MYIVQCKKGIVVKAKQDYFIFYQQTLFGDGDIMEKINKFPSCNCNRRTDGRMDARMDGWTHGHHD